MFKRGFILFVILVCFLASSLAAAGREYLIEDSNSRRLTENELWKWDYETLGYIFHEIFARYGYVFEEGNYKKYFVQRSWYTANTNPDNQTQVYDKLTWLEWRNYDTIKAVRQVMRDSGNLNEGGLNWRDVIGEGSSSALNFVSMDLDTDNSATLYTAPSYFAYSIGRGLYTQYALRPIITVAGWDGNWLLIRLVNAIGSSVSVGYIHKSSIGNYIYAPTLNFEYTRKKCTRSVTLTDDPDYASSELKQLLYGDTVTFLTAYNSGPYRWAYVETTVNGKTARGFIPADALN
ncbi:MAG: YARHG domain-containing protein [Clostridiales bacterium]|nr:YARHG domain-containing protein [Clostridiales bacterium]